MENNRKPAFLGEGLIRSGQDRTMVRSLTHEDILRRSDVRDLPLLDQDQVVLRLFREARDARDTHDRQKRLDSLKDLTG